MTDRELMQQALHTLEGWANHGKWVWPESALEQAKRNTTESITALRERLAQPEQEPVAHVYLFEPNGRPRVAWDNAKDIKIGDKLYTAPPQRKPLTDEEISNIWCKVSNTDFVTADTHEFARAIEAAHGIGGQT